MLLDTETLQNTLDLMLGYEIRFCEEYMVDFDPNKALIRAQIHGSNKAANNKALASALLDKEECKTYLNHLRAKMGLDSGVTAEKLLSELAMIAFQDARQFITMEDGTVRFRDLEEMPNTAAIKEIKVASMSGDFKQDGRIHEIKAYDKMKALELLMRAMGMFTDNVNLTSGGKTLENAPSTVFNVVINHRKPGESIN